MSLMEAEYKELYIDPIFDMKQEWIWTADRAKGESRKAWVVDLQYGYSYWTAFHGNYYIRSVRSRQ